MFQYYILLRIIYIMLNYRIIETIAYMLNLTIYELK